MKTLLPYASFLAVILFGCSDKNDVRPGNGSKGNDSWLVQKSEIVHWGSERDKIKSIDATEFVSLEQSNLSDEDLVFAIEYNGIIKVFPVAVLGNHEIVNDSVDDYYFSLTYCPLTGSAICWNRKINGKVNQFGVSGMLYNDNLIPYDRQTGSHWSQMGNLCINGDLIGHESETRLLIETKFSTIKTAYPDALVLSHVDCVDGVCVRYKSGSDYGDPTDENGNDILIDSRYFGIAKDQETILFSLNLFVENTTILQTRFKGQNIIVAGNKNLNYFASFVFVKDSPDETIFAINDELPLIMGDSRGNRYDLFGTVLSGPDKGKQLASPNAFIANSFAWNDIFSDIKVFKKD